MEQFFANFKRDDDVQLMKNIIMELSESTDNYTRDINLLNEIFSLIDLTSLNSNDSTYTIQDICEKLNRFHVHFPSFSNVAALCVYPVFSPVLKGSLHVFGIKKVVVSGGFPSSQTFTDVKVAEAKKALSFGMDEIDIVISVGEFLDGNYEFVVEEIRMIKDMMPENAQLKVILETGLLESSENIWRASLLAMEGGADFIKTSTGKVPVNATPEAAYTMLKAIKSFNESTGIKVGIKVAGGISNSRDAIFYYLLVKEILGEGWLNNSMFRIGASSLANNILSDIKTIENNQKTEIKYF
jgi:deoxyribose-phosphate aldolase